MKSVAAAAMLHCLLLNVALAQMDSPLQLQPTPLEAFAARPSARVAQSSEVGRIESAEAYAVISAIIVEDAAEPTQKMRGIRIDLSSRSAADQIYLDETRLEAIKKALDEIAGGMATYLKNPRRQGRDSAPYRYMGAAEFWHPDQRIHTLNAAFYIAPDSIGLSVSAYKNQEFRFPDRSPAQLSAAIARAMDEFKQR